VKEGREKGAREEEDSGSRKGKVTFLKLTYLILTKTYLLYIYIYIYIYIYLFISVI